MNKEEILAMEAGEALDLLIGINIFNWKPIDTEEGCYEEPDGTTKVVEFNKYSTDISTAWQVVEKMRESDRYNFGRMQEGYKDRGQYDDTFITFCSDLMEVMGISIEEYAYPAVLTIMRSISPEAICKATLIAKL